MADSKGVYFGGGNTGLATILPRESRGDVFDQAFQLGEMDRRRKAQEAQLRYKQQQDDINKIKNFESWRFYTPTINSKYDQLISDVKKGNYDPMDLQMRVNEIASLSQSTMQMQDEFKQAQTMYKQDKKVKGAESWYINKYHSDPSEDNLKKIQEEGLEPYAFLDEQGGSKYIDSTQAFEDVISTALKDFVQQKDLSGPSRKYIGRGLQQISQDEFEAKFRNFAKVNRATGQIEVKDVDQLIEDGVLSVFLNDPYTKRILEDEATALAGNRPVSEEHYAQALKSHLAPRTGGEIYKGQKLSTAREDTSNLGDKEDQARANDWLRKARAGIKEGGWDELIQTDYQGFTIQDVKVDPEGGIVRLIMTKPEDQKDAYGNSTGQSKIKTTVREIPFSSMTDSGLLGFYNQAISRRKGARIFDSSRPSAEGEFDNLGYAEGELN